MERKEVIADIIINMLFNCIDCDERGVRFKAYNVDEKQVKYLLEKYDTDKYNEIVTMLKEAYNDERRDV